MAALDVEVEQTATTPAHRGRLVFWLAVAWIAIVASAAIAADWLPLTSPSEMDLLARRAGLVRIIGSAPMRSAATS